VWALRGAISTADAVLIATPEYNGSVPGQPKNALDWASRPFPDNALRGKPVAVVGASTGLFGAVWAQAELRKVLTTIGARVAEEELPVGQTHDAFTADGALADSGLRAALGRGGGRPGERGIRAPVGVPSHRSAGGDDQPDAAQQQGDGRDDRQRWGLAEPRPREQRRAGSDEQRRQRDDGRAGGTQRPVEQGVPE